MKFYYKKSRAVMLFALLAILTTGVAFMVYLESFRSCWWVVALVVFLFISLSKYIRRDIRSFRNIPCLTLYSDRLVADPELLGEERSVLIRFDEIDDISIYYNDKGYSFMWVRCSDPRPFYASNRNALEFIYQHNDYEKDVLVFSMPISSVAGSGEYAFYSIRDTFYDYCDKTHQT